MLSLRTFTFSEESDHMKYIQGSTEVALRMLGGAQDAALQHGSCNCWSEVLRSEVVDFSANSKGRSAQIRWREESSRKGNSNSIIFLFLWQDQDFDTRFSNDKRRAAYKNLHALHGARLQSNPHGPTSQQKLYNTGKRTVRRAVTIAVLWLCSPPCNQLTALHGCTASVCDRICSSTHYTT